jgi:hypothetical protein
VDEIDRAQELQEQALQNALKGRPERLPATGYCYYCSEEISAGKRFCDEYCRDDFDKEQRLLKMSPKVDN